MIFNKPDLVSVFQPDDYNLEDMFLHLVMSGQPLDLSQTQDIPTLEWIDGDVREPARALIRAGLAKAVGEDIIQAVEREIIEPLEIHETAISALNAVSFCENSLLPDYVMLRLYASDRLLRLPRRLDDYAVNGRRVQVTEIICAGLIQPAFIKGKLQHYVREEPVGTKWNTK